MKYLAAYLLLTIGGNAAPAAKDITSLLATVGIEAESERIETLIAQLAGKDINEVNFISYKLAGRTCLKHTKYGQCRESRYHK